MNLLGAIKTFYQSDSSTATVSLRGVLGDSFYADVVTPPISRPYATVGESGTHRQEQTKAGARIDKVTVVFTLFANTRSQAETILELLETVYCDATTPLTIVDRTHMATYFSNRRSYFDGDNAWQGMLELVVQVSKP